MAFAVAVEWMKSRSRLMSMLRFCKNHARFKSKNCTFAAKIGKVTDWLDPYTETSSSEALFV